MIGSLFSCENDLVSIFAHVPKLNLQFSPNRDAQHCSSGLLTVSDALSPVVKIFSKPYLV